MRRLSFHLYSICHLRTIAAGYLLTILQIPMVSLQSFQAPRRAAAFEHPQELLAEPALLSAQLLRFLPSSRLSPAAFPLCRLLLNQFQHLLSSSPPSRRSFPQSSSDRCSIGLLQVGLSSLLASSRLLRCLPLSEWRFLSHAFARSFSVFRSSG